MNADDQAADEPVSDEPHGDGANPPAGEANESTRPGAAVPGAPAPDEHPARGRPRTVFPVVGIGASAGGLAALEAFFAALPAKTDDGMAFVIIQHLDPEHTSILPDLLGRYTAHSVYKVKDGMALKPNCIYVIPPNRDMALAHGTLHLLQPAARHGVRQPIDFFFRSLAQDQEERAICIILSGTGSDGTLGLKAVKEAGGMAMVQAPETADYDGMPRNAIATGLVDYILPPDKMPGELAAYVQRAYGRRRKVPAAHPVDMPDGALEKVLILLRQAGHDFSGYKQQTLERRVERRMAVAQIDDLSDYVRYLQQSPAELEALFRELLIGVTNFFRDPGAWDALQTLVLPRLFAGATKEGVRIWVPACATGEEAYTLAILCREHLDAAKQSRPVQIFATDVDAGAIEKARSGLYSANIAADVAPERLAGFFSQEDGAYRISKSIRDTVMFATQDVLKDPPFSRVDLICCRNLLIYLRSDAQKSLLQTFHYALKQDGFLLLGTSETISPPQGLYGELDRKWKIYQRKGPRSATLTMRDQGSVPAAPAAGEGERPVAATRKPTTREVAERAMLDSYMPASVLVNDAYDVLYVHGRADRYLAVAPGEGGMNLLRMAREGLRTELAAAVRRASARQIDVRLNGLQVKANPSGAAGSGDTAPVNVIVHPIHSPTVAAGLLLITFEETSPAAVPAGAGKDETRGEQGPRLLVLEQELRAKEEYLQTVIEELESTNEELKSTNEEAQSANEELQSANEELTTSREEMQSVNEELVTVNTELQSKIDQLSIANNDISNLLASTNIATLFVDHHLRVKRFTPATSRVIRLIQTDVGRPVSDITSRLIGYDRLTEDVHEVLATLIPRETVVQHQDGAWYQMSIQPYRTLDNIIEGAVLTFVDISVQKGLQLALQQSQERLALLFELLPVGVSVLDGDGKVVYVNPALEKMLGYTRDELLRGDHLRHALLRPGGGIMASEDEASNRAASERREIDHVETGVRRRDGRVVWTDVSVVPVSLADWRLIVVTFDLSASRRDGEDEGAELKPASEEGGKE